MKNLQKLALAILEDKDIPMNAKEILEAINEGRSMDIDINSSQLDIVMQRHSKPTIMSLNSYVPSNKYFSIVSSDPYTYILLNEDDDDENRNDFYDDAPNIFDDNDEEYENEFIEVGGLTVYDKTEDDCICFEIKDMSVTLSLKKAAKIYDYLGDLLEKE